MVVLGLVVALVPATSAFALTSEACPTSIPSAGFTDLGGLSTDVVD